MVNLGEHFAYLKEKMESLGARYIHHYDGVIDYVSKKGNDRPEFKAVSDHYKNVLGLELKISFTDDDTRLFWSIVPMTSGDRWQSEAGPFLFLAEAGGLKIVDKENEDKEIVIDAEGLEYSKSKAQEYWDDYRNNKFQQDVEA